MTITCFKKLSQTVLLLLFLSVHFTSHAQTSLGQVSGTITDATGAVLDEAAINVTNVDTKAVRTVATDASGFYIVSNLPIGNYTLKVTHAGFRGEERTGFAITADAHLSGDFQMQVGVTSDTVTVSAVLGETLNTTSGELAHVIDTKQVANLALNGRNYTQLMTLIPGAVVTNPDIFSVTTSLASTNQVSNGNRADSSNLTVDGAYNQVAGSNGSLMNNVSPDFIQEVKIATSNFSAEYGRTSGPAFNIVTKNGTNQFHGGAFEYIRNNDLDARNYFATKRTQLIYNDFGYDVGGPIIKNKLFFFGGEEFKRLRQQASPTRFTVPSPAMLNGDFSASAQLFFPGTKTPIPGNNISSLITADGKAIANVYRVISALGITPVTGGGANNLTLAPGNPLNFREDLVRLDYTLSHNNYVYGRWISDHNTLTDPYGTFSDSGVLPTTPTIRNRPGQSVLVAETWNINSNIINQAQANFSYAAQRIPPAGVNWERGTYGFQYNKLYPTAGEYPNGIPKVNITGFAPFQGPNFALHSPTTDIELADTISIIKGNHLIKAGAVVIRDRIDQNGRPYYTGNVTFNPVAGAINTTGNAVADALTGNFQSYQESSADPTGHFRFTQPEAFAQDSWKATQHLSLEFGVRFQYIQAMYTQGNNMANFDPSVYNSLNAVKLNPNGTLIAGSGNPYSGLVRAGSGVPSDQMIRVPNVNTSLFPLIPAGAPRGLYNMNGAIGPRIGFAFAATDKLVIRGGFGSFYYRPEGNVTFSQVNLAPFLANTEFDNGNLATLGNGTPNTSALQAAITGINPQLKNPYVEQYSLNVQRQLPKQMLIEVSYVGNVGHHLLRQPNINFPDLTQVAANTSFSTNYFNPYKGYSSIGEYLSDSNSNYNALQVYLSRRAGRITFTAGYTYGKTLGDSVSNGFQSGDNYRSLSYNYGLSSIDRRHAFVGTAVWDIARLRNAPALIRETVGGWQLSAVIRAQSGPYYTITSSTSTGTRRANYVGGPKLVTTGRSANSYINTAAFTAPPAGAFGNSGVSNVLGPGLQQTDATLSKGFFTEKRVQGKFQADFFNAFNHTNYSTLNTTTTSSSFGTLSAAYPPRQMQLGAKLIF